MKKSLKWLTAHPKKRSHFCIFFVCFCVLRFSLYKEKTETDHQTAIDQAKKLFFLNVWS